MTITTATGTGTVVSIKPFNKYGFIQPDAPGNDIFSHSSELAANLPFDETLPWKKVRFDIVDGPRGVRATNMSAT